MSSTVRSPRLQKMIQNFNKAVFLLFSMMPLFVSHTYSQQSISKQEIHDHVASFQEYFPDKELAKLVATKLNKSIEDRVTLEELASITGEFVVGPGETSNLKGIGYLTGIATFSCCKNEVTEIPAEIGKLTQLTYLDLCKAYSLRLIPTEIGKLKRLKKIRLALTEVQAIPKEIGNLTELEILWLDSNQLQDIPAEIGNLIKLKDLDLHANDIRFIPNEICKLNALKSLDLSHCGLEELPENIGNLKRLQTLNLFNNKLKHLPKSISRLDELSELNIYDNFKLDEAYKDYLPRLLQRKYQR